MAALGPYFAFAALFHVTGKISKTADQASVEEVIWGFTALPLSREIGFNAEDNLYFES